MQNLTDEPELTKEAKEQCLLSAYMQLELARLDIKSIMDRFGGPKFNPDQFNSIRTSLSSAERLIQLGN